jgi:hypothetical protein
MFAKESHEDPSVSSGTKTVVDPYCDGGSSPPQPVTDIVPGATPAKRKRGKSLSRRTGQKGHVEKSGRWFVLRFWKDIPGQEQRALVRERICPISGPGRLSKAKLKERAKEIIEASGADSVEYFKEVVKEDRALG